MSKTLLRLEALEDRCTPTTFGMPWADPTRVTISFAPDGAPIAGRTSNLFDSLNQDRSPNEWQRDLLRALNAWASVTSLDIAVVGDDGSRFGTPGRLQGDPRFGDIRIGGNSLSDEVLAVASPPDPALAGTLAGDVFINTNYRFKDTPYDLYSVALHEVGHALGLDHSSNPNSPMFARFNNTKTTLTSGDIAAIRNLYGQRRHDRHEGASGNGSIANAAAIHVPTAYDGTTPLLTFADLTTSGDADVFWFDTIPNREDDEENITIRVQTSGLSLMAPKVTVYFRDADGSLKEVANAKSDSADFTGDTLELTFDGNDDDDGSTRRYYVRVEAADDAPFRVGRYGLAVNFDGVGAVSEGNLESVIRGPYHDATANALAALLRDPSNSLVRNDFGTNDTIGSANNLSPTRAQSGNARFESLASLDQPTDIDVYRVTAPASTSNRVLTVNVWSLPLQSARPQVELFNAAGGRVDAEILVNDSGSYTVQANNLTPGTTYFVRVAGDGALGNYYLTADFGGIASNVMQFAQGEVSSQQVREDQLYVGQAQLFHFALSASGASTQWGASVTMSVFDSNGNLALTITTTAGQTVSAPATLLRPGTYTVRFAVATTDGSPAQLNFALRGNRLSDPIGPVKNDITLKTEFENPDKPGEFIYPGNVVTTDPFYWRPLSF